MKIITCYLDLTVREAYEDFQALPAMLMGLSYGMVYKPVASRRCPVQDAQANEQLLGLWALACSAQANPNRYVCDTVFSCAWSASSGQACALDLEQAALCLPRVLSPLVPVHAHQVLDHLEQHTQEATALGMGVANLPLYVVDGLTYSAKHAAIELQTYLYGGGNTQLAQRGEGETSA